LDLYNIQQSKKDEEDEMRLVRTLCGEYEEEALYDMDETGLFWRSNISIALST
jgi:hypothetical protein